MPTGTIISVRITAEGIVNGEAGLAISEVWSLSDEVVDDWEPRPTQHGPPRLTRITVDGTPSVSVDLSLDGSPLPGADATAARVIDAIAAVCAADPGVYGALDLAITPALTATLVTDRHFGRDGATGHTRPVSLAFSDAIGAVDAVFVKIDT